MQNRGGADHGERWDAAREDMWEDDWEPRPRKSLLRRAFSLLKLAVFIAPVAFFAYGSLVADCRGRSSSGWSGMGWTGFLSAGVCARGEILGSAAAMPDNLAVLRRLIN